MAKLKQPRPFAATRSAVSLFSAPAPVAPPSEQVVAAVLQYADAREEHDDGRITLRFTAARLEREDMVLLLGEERQRARDVSIVWDEAECEMVRVIDLAPLRAGRDSVDQANLYAAARKRSLRPSYPTTHRFAA